MQPEEHVDNLIIGSGEGGKYLAWHLAKAGERTVVVERRWIGGSCPNINCLPSKNEIWSAGIASVVRRAEEFGVRTGPVSVDMPAVLKRKREMVQGLIEMHLDRYRESGARLVMGEAVCVGPRTIEVTLNEGGTQRFTTDRLFLNVGSHPAIPPIPGLAESRPLTNIEALELDRIPPHLLVIGGGYVGLELGQAYRRFGSEVAIIEQGSQLLGREDADVAEEMRGILEDEGIVVRLEAEVLSVEGVSGENVRARIRTPNGEEVVTGSDVLVAAGRSPNTEGLGLEAAGVELDERGYIRVDEKLRTSADGVWAIGECAGSPHFTHVSLDDFRVIRDNLAGQERSTTDRLVPYCIFTDPPMARVGLSEEEARRDGVSVRVANMPTAAVLRTRTSSQRTGLMKALVAADDDRILGFTMIGQDAGEVMATVQTAMLAGLPYTTLRDAIYTHPTMTEGLNALFGEVPERN